MNKELNLSRNKHTHKEQNFNVVWLCIRYTIYIHGRSHRKHFINDSRWFLQSQYRERYKEQDDSFSLSWNSLKSSLTHAQSASTTSLYIPCYEYPDCTAFWHVCNGFITTLIPSSHAIHVLYLSLPKTTQTTPFFP